MPGPGWSGDRWHSVEASQWPFYAVLLIGYAVFVFVLAREVWFGLWHGRTGIYWRGTILRARKVIYERSDTPWKFGFALAANLSLLIASLILPLLMLRSLGD